VYGTGFPLVLTHGFTASLEAWAPQVEDFSHKYQLIVYDARGHGLSSAPAGAENYSLDILVEDLHHILTHLGVDKAFVGGLPPLTPGEHTEEVLSNVLHLSSQKIKELREREVVFARGEAPKA